MMVRFMFTCLVNQNKNKDIFSILTDSLQLATKFVNWINENHVNYLRTSSDLKTENGAKRHTHYY
jgi:hypothetical protein